MKSLSNLKLNNFQVDFEHYIEFLNPEIINLPVCQNANIHCHKNDIIKIDTILYTNELNEPVYSSVSGELIDVEYKYVEFNKRIPTLKIINNFKEEKNKKPSIKDLKVLSKEEFIDNLIKKGVKKHNSQESFLAKNFTKEIKCLAIKCFDDEPLCNNSIFSLYNNLETVFYTIDSIRQIFCIDNIILLIKNINYELIIKCEELLASYPSIKIKHIPNLYPTNDKELFFKEVFSQKSKTDTNKILDLNIVNIMDIYNAIKRKKEQSEKFITIIDDNNMKCLIMKVKIGTSLLDVVNKYRNLQENEVVYLNNIFRREAILSLDKYIISYSTNILYISNYAPIKEKECINCGLCYKTCPKKLNPLNINFDECIKCGLCMYNCPCNIDLLKRSEKNEK